MFNKKAEMGIGTLILFIAMILVAAVAASVLIQTAGTLQAKALLTGSKTQAEVSTSMTVIYVHGENASASTGRHLNQTYVKVKLSPGSDPIKFDDMVVVADTLTTRASLTYDSTIDCTNKTDILGAKDVSFGARHLMSAPKYGAGYLYRGDIVQLCLENPAPLTEGKDFKLSLIPKQGSPVNLYVRTPDVMVQSRVSLYP